MVFNSTEKLLKKGEKIGNLPSYKQVFKDLFKYVTPTVIESILFSLAVMVDGIMVSSYSNDASAAISTSKQPILLMISFISAITICSIALIGRRKGLDDKEGANNIFHTQLQITVVLALILGLIFFIFREDVVYFMGARGQVLDFAITYFGVHSLFFIFNALRLSINAAQKAIGNTKISMISNVVANIINVILNYLLIFGNLGFPELGILGAAIATITGYFVAFLITIYSLRKKGSFIEFSFIRLFTFNKTSFESIKSMYPTTLIDQGFVRIGFIITSLLINYLGSEAQYINGVAFDLYNLSFSVSDGFSIGLSVLVAQQLGKSRPDIATIYSKVTMFTSFIVVFFIALFLVFFKDNIIDLYSPATLDVRNYTLYIVNFVIIGIFFQNLQWIPAGVLKGAGDTKFLAKTSFFAIMILRPIMTYILAYSLGLGLTGAWIALIIDQFIRFVRNTVRFSSRKSYSIKY